MSKSESLLSLFAQLLFLKSKGNNLLSALFKKEQLRANRSPRSLQKSHREKFAIVAYYNRATGAIHSFSRANRSFAHKKTSDSLEKQMSEFPNLNVTKLNIFFF